MKLIQVVLFALVLGGLIAYFRWLRSHLLDRVVVMALALLALLLIVVPDWSADLARVLGVGRGVDVVIYLSLVGIGWVWLVQFSRTRELEARLTELVRHIALAEAQPPPQQ